MRELIQSLRTGEIEVAEVPCAAARAEHLLIQTSRTLISSGTERMLLEFGRASLVQKARQQPDKVREALDKIRTDGILPTLRAVQNRLDQPLALGYCNVGKVLEVGAGVEGFQIGDRVCSNGCHAEVVCVPKNLCCKIPDGVSDEDAVLAIVGAIGLQGIRLAAPALGETFFVSGLGLIGLLVVQLLRAQGCRVLGADFDSSRLALARKFGAETVDLSSGADPVEAARSFSRGRGVDGVLITASSKSDEPVQQAAQMCRKRGRIILVGSVGMKLSRTDFYEKELSFQVSCSYGPGRYDPAYEEQGVDYPLGFVRWTAQRNFEAILDMMCEGKLSAAELITHRFPIAQASSAYDLLASKSPSLGVVLQYAPAADDSCAAARQTSVCVATVPPRPRGRVVVRAEAPVVSFIGSGNYALQVLIPAFRSNGAVLRQVVSRSGLSAVHAARKYGFQEAATDPEVVLRDACVDAVVIATRHDTHAQFVGQALAAGKHVFVEKPLALNDQELTQIENLYRSLQDGDARRVLAVGFNRRYAPHARKMAQLLGQVAEPKSLILTVNAGYLPNDHWLHDPRVGGGRIVGEACHFIDLVRFLCGSPITRVQATTMQANAAREFPNDKVAITLQCADGSIGTIHYLANGHRSYPKERLEVFCAGRILQLDNFRRLRGYGWKGFKQMNSWRQDKGHNAHVKAFLDAIQGAAAAPIPFEELVEVSQATLDAKRAAEGNQPLKYPGERTRQRAA
jgi:predicted dehydrogenase/threonine dehydrogenase-like Zn-dependent dehydrogenase